MRSRFQLLGFKLNVLTALCIPALVFAQETGNSGSNPLPLSQLNAPTQSGTYEYYSKSPDPAKTPLSSFGALPQKHQLNPLHAIVSIEFPKTVQTVGDAAVSVLSLAGYELLQSGPNTSPYLPALLASPLPVVHRRFQSISIKEFLRSLAGPGYMTVVDHIHRRVTYDPVPLLAASGQYLPDLDTKRTSIILSNASMLIPENRTSSIVGEQYEEWQSVSPNPEPSDSINASTEAIQDKALEKKQSNHNIANPGKTRHSKILNAYKSVEDTTIVFDPASWTIRPDDHSTLGDIAGKFNKSTDVFSVIGCSRGHATDKKKNIALAYRRAHRVAESLMILGVPSTHILEEACWSDTLKKDGLPNHGAVVSLKRTSRSL